MSVHVRPVGRHLDSLMARDGTAAASRLSPWGAMAWVKLVVEDASIALFDLDGGRPD
jgi:hypothetical protein